MVLRKADSYIAAIKNDSIILNGFTNGMAVPPAPPVKQVTFEATADSPFTTENTSTSNDTSNNNRIKTTTRSLSVVGISELKLLRYKMVVVLVLGICCIIGLFTLPIIFYYVEGSSGASLNISPTTGIGNVNISQSTLCNESVNGCPDDVVYTYEALKLVSTYSFCLEEALKKVPELQNCGNDSACIAYIMCQEVRQQYCTAEWRVLELNKSEELFDCTDYGETAPLNCSDQFDLANNGSVCLPLCGEFSQYSKSFTAFLPTWLAVFSGLNVIGGIISLIVSVYKIKKLFHYPQILIVMNSILISILSLFVLISTFPVENWRPLCSKEFLFDAFDEPNFFCALQGFTYFTIISLYCYFWFLYTLHLLLRITKPLLMLQLEQSNHAGKIHIIEVMVAILMATVPYIVFFANSDFHISTFPPLYCGAGPTHNFYGVIIPTVVACCITVIMMLFVLYKIHIQKGIFRRGSGGICKLCCIELHTSEVKIFLTFSYLLIVMVLQWTTFSIDNARFDATFSVLLAYTQCAYGGIRTGLDCDPYRRDFEARADPGLLISFFTLFSFLSYSNLPFLIQFKTVKEFVTKTARRLSYRRTLTLTGRQRPQP